MHGAVKAGLLMGCIEILVNVGLTVAGMSVCCPVCPVVGSMIASMVAGWLTAEWTKEWEKQAGIGGAVAGALTAIGSLIGMILPVIGYVLLDKVPGFQDLITIGGTTENQFSQYLTLFLVLCALTVAAIALVGVMIGLGAIVAKYRAATKVLDSGESKVGDTPQKAVL